MTPEQERTWNHINGCIQDYVNRFLSERWFEQPPTTKEIEEWCRFRDNLRKF